MKLTRFLAASLVAIFVPFAASAAAVSIFDNDVITLTDGGDTSWAFDDTFTSANSFDVITFSFDNQTSSALNI